MARQIDEPQRPAPYSLDQIIDEAIGFAVDAANSAQRAVSAVTGESLAPIAGALPPVGNAPGKTLDHGAKPGLKDRASLLLDLIRVARQNLDRLHSEIGA